MKVPQGETSFLHQNDYRREEINFASKNQIQVKEKEEGITTRQAEMSHLEGYKESWEFLLYSLGNGKLVKASAWEIDMQFVKMVFSAILGATG